MAAAGTPKDDTGLERKMESRHLTMISLGGVIGTGLFVSSGYAIHQVDRWARSSLTRPAPCSSTA